MPEAKTGRMNCSDEMMRTVFAIIASVSEANVYNLPLEIKDVRLQHV